MTNTPVVLVVEDDPDHTELILRSLRARNLTDAIHHVRDGQEALDYLFRRGPYADPVRAPRPAVVLLDLRLPKVDGLEVLRQAKKSEDLRHIPIVILTTSSADHEIAQAYAGHANSYVVKPSDLGQFTALLNILDIYWLQWNQPATV